MIETLLSGVTSILPFILTLGILIFFHELGHFLAARWVGIKVEVFSIGFGKKIFQFSWKNTIFAISAIPLGGYVKLYGDDPQIPIPPENQHQAFWHKPYLSKLIVVLAGPVANLLLAWVIYALLALKGEWHRQPVVGDLNHKTPAYEIGFRPGDRITSINNIPIVTLEDYQSAMNQNIGQSVVVRVIRTGYPEGLNFTAPVISVENPHPVGLPKIIGAIDGLSFDNVAPVIGVLHNSLAYTYGLRTGDIIESINNHPVQYWREIEPTLTLLSEKTVTLQIKRPSSTKTNDFEPITLTFKLPAYVGTLQSLGIEIPELYIKNVLPRSPAEFAGLKSGDKILKINDVTVKSWSEVLELVKSSPTDQELKLHVLREGQELTFSIKPENITTTNLWGLREKRKMLGIASFYQTIPPAEIQKTYGWQFWQRAFKRTWDTTAMTIYGIVKLISGNVSPRNIGGIITIGQVAHQSFIMGLFFFWQTMALISINLFVLNLLPIPVLDGGHVVLFTIEKIKGSPLSVRQIMVIQNIGLAIVLTLMGFALFNDVTRLLGF